MSLFVQPFPDGGRLAERAGAVLSLAGHSPSLDGWSLIGPIRRYRGGVADFVRGRMRGQAGGWRCLLVNAEGPAGALDFGEPVTDASFMLRDRATGRVYGRALDVLADQLDGFRARFEVRMIDFPDLFVTALWAKGSKRSFFLPTRLPHRGRPEPVLLEPPAFCAHILEALRDRARAADGEPKQAATRTNRLSRARTRLGLTL